MFVGVLDAAGVGAQLRGSQVDELAEVTLQECAL
jgi:hypothetical protein